MSQIHLLRLEVAFFPVNLSFCTENEGILPHGDSCAVLVWRADGGNIAGDNPDLLLSVRVRASHHLQGAAAGPVLRFLDVGNGRHRCLP
ncbi:hypothetical protein C2845_PM13G16000 [Panicum miliaceum]|uniref:Uncharacterized protein n=1 Tax=Panicum miliaceum TaxID=4540 RepID=A0A3L6RGM7_PANMI|nr:hypothetical protein C2845_PM13G16000 [Panicum miliaceum]